MKYLLPILLTAISIFPASAQTIPVSPEKAAKIGGFLQRPDLLKGKVVFVNSQTIVPEVEMVGVVAELSRAGRAKIEIVKAEKITNSNFESTLKGIKNASAGIFIVEQVDNSTTLLIAPESKWAMVNIGALNADKPAKSILAQRTQKEMVRAFLMLCGGYESTFNNSLMSNITSLKDIDKIDNYHPPMDIVGRSRKFLPKVGVDTRPMVTYAQAVKEGWAPAPTNDIQKAIWDKVRATPKNPIKITFDPKKGR